MPATLTASPNPVRVWGANGTGTTTIQWNTGIAAKGWLYLTTSSDMGVLTPETLFDGDPTLGALSGSKALAVAAGNLYTFSLRRVSNNATLATLVVRVEDLDATLTAEAAATAVILHKNPPQAIYNLKVHAGVDTVRVTFNTVQLTIPHMRLTAPDGTEVASALALFAGMQTAHQAVLGQITALPQAEALTLTIVAPGEGQFGTPMEAKVTTQVTTGSRTARVEFNTVKVRTDGDPGVKGSGEFLFLFAVADTEDRSPLARPWPEYQGNISDDDAPREVDQQLDIPLAPRSLSLEVIGRESDFSWTLGLDVYGIGATFEPDKTGAASGGWGEQAWVCNTFDISDLGPRSLEPFSMSTGDYEVAFSVDGFLDVFTAEGVSPVFKSRNLAAARARHLSLPAPGSNGHMSLPGGKEGDRNSGDSGANAAVLLARGANGAIYRRDLAASRARSQQEGWSPVAPAVEGPVVAVATAADRVMLLALDGKGAALQAQAEAGHAAEKWTALGGTFTGRLTALGLAKSVELFAADAGGTVFHRSLDAQTGTPTTDWQRVGAGTSGTLAAVRLDATAFALFALGREGAVLHRFHHGGRWQSEDWQTIEGAAGVLIGAAAEGRDLALAVIGADLALRTLTWRGYPERTAPAKWIAQGDLQSWLVSPQPKPEATPRIAEVA